MDVKILCPCGATSVADCAYPQLPPGEYEGCIGPPPPSSELAPYYPEWNGAGEWSAATLPPIDDAAVHGSRVTGRGRRAARSRRTRNGILVATLGRAGSAIGAGPHVYLSGTRHGVNLSACLVGPTSSGRKGETITVSLVPLKQADPDWHQERIHSGLGSGEAVIRLLEDGTAESPRADSRSSSARANSPEY